MFSALKTCVEKSNMDWAKLDSICAEGCPAMTGKRAGCLALLEQKLERPLLKYHSIMHYSPVVIVWKKSGTEACHVCDGKMCK